MGNFSKGLNGNPDGCDEQHSCKRRGVERCSLAVVVGMIFIRMLCSNNGSAPHDDGAENVGERFDGVGDERVRMAEYPGSEFGARQNGVDDQTHEGDTQTSLQASVRHARKLRWRVLKLKQVLV